MNKFKIIIFILLTGSLSLQTYGQTSSAHQHSTVPSEQTIVELATQISALHQKVALLQHQLNTGAKDGSKGSMKAMPQRKGMAKMKMNSSNPGVSEEPKAMKGMMKEKMGMGGMSNKMKDTKPMSMAMGMSRMGGGMMDMMGKGKGMMGMMGMMKNMGDMIMDSTLPGFPGASHIYHVGSTGYFLDHDAHVQLTVEQRSKLNKIKEMIALQGATVDRKILEAEQQVWVLTASDQPDAKSIEAKIREIEKLRIDYRIAVIQSVGEAAQVLTKQQQSSLVGLEESQGAKEVDKDEHATH